MSVTMYAVQGVGNDNNSGSTTSASPKASGTGASTIAGATVTLSVDAPDLSTVVVGDTIRLNGRTDGKNPTTGTDVFNITAVDDTLKTVDVSPAPNSITSGVTWAIGGAVATLGRLMITLGQGDSGYAKGTFNEAIDMINAMAAGAISTVIRVIGYSSTPGDGGVALLDSNNTKTHAITLRSGDAYWSFENIRITRFTGQGFRAVSASTPSRFVNCEVDHCGGTYGFGTGLYAILVNCTAHDNTNDGFNAAEMCMFIGCIAKDNGGHGFFGAGGNAYHWCVAIGNVLSGIYQNDDANHKGLIVVNCLVDGSGKTTDKGVRIADDVSVRQGVVINTVVYDCVTGIEAQGDNSIWSLMMNNDVSGNTTNYTNSSTQFGGITTTPTFVNRAAGDYTPDAGAPQIEAGYDYTATDFATSTGTPVAIGPLQPVAGGGATTDFRVKIGV